MALQGAVQTLFVVRHKLANRHIVRKRFQNFQPGRHAVTGYHILFVLVQGVVITGGNLIEQADAGLFGKLPGFCQKLPV